MLCKPYEVVQNYEVADVRLNLPFQSCSIPIVNVGRWVGNLELGMGPPQRKVLQNLSADLRSFFIFYESATDLLRNIEFHHYTHCCWNSLVNSVIFG